MARRRRGSRRKPYKVVKYSNETQNFQETFVPIPPSQEQPNPPRGPYRKACVIIEPLNAQGMRKVKNITLQIICTLNHPLIWALVYVPQGTNPNQLQFGSPDEPLSLYEPNQNVIMSGVTINGSPRQTWRTRLARNLNSGDGITLIFDSEIDVNDTFAISCTCNYAITY